MSIEKNALAKLLEYRAAHLLWKSLPDGSAKVEAKRVRGQAHSEMLAAAELYQRQVDKAPDHR